MQTFISTWNEIMCLAVFVGIITIMAFLYTYALPHDAFSKAISRFVTKNILWIGFIISLSAMISSLVYSDVIGFPPCMFCWWARVMFYPQVLLFGYALIKKDHTILPYTLLLTTCGLVITTYHSIIQMIGESAIPCSVSGVSCLTRDVYMFGFITIPFMGLVGFATLLLSILVAKKHNKTKI